MSGPLQWHCAPAQLAGSAGAQRLMGATSLSSRRVSWVESRHGFKAPTGGHPECCGGMFAGGQNFTEHLLCAEAPRTPCNSTRPFLNMLCSPRVLCWGRDRRPFCIPRPEVMGGLAQRSPWAPSSTQGSGGRLSITWAGLPRWTPWGAVGAGRAQCVALGTPLGVLQGEAEEHSGPGLQDSGKGLDRAEGCVPVQEGTQEWSHSEHRVSWTAHCALDP